MTEIAVPAAAVTAAPEASVSRILRRNRSALLDCIRAVAIIGVLVFHVATRFDTAGLDPVAAWARRFGLLGVDVFFPLSGFLITRYLIAEPVNSVRAFFIHRLLRIVPIYLVAVTIYWAGSYWFGVETEILHRIWIVYLFLTGWFIFADGNEMVPFTITWSLSVEVFAYLLIGIFAWISRRHLLYFLVATTIACFLIRLSLELGGNPNVYNYPPARLDSIAIGGIVAILVKHQVNGLAVILAVLTMASYVAAMTYPELWTTLKYTFITLGTCFFIVVFDRVRMSGTNPIIAAMSSIGFYSYFTYLFHLFNIHLLLELWEQLLPGSPPFWPLVILSLLLTQIQAMISFRFFEGPLIRYGKILDLSPGTKPTR